MLQDIRYAFRRLAREPGFVIIALLTLGLGIGANTTMFSFINALVFQRLPYPETERIVQVYATLPEFKSANLAPGNFADAKTLSTTFAAIAAYSRSSSNLAKPGQPADQASAYFVDDDFFSVLGLAPALGRAFSAADNQPGNNDVVVISHSFWSRRFNSDPTVLGRTLRQDGRTVTIVGVMPPEAENRLIWGPVDLWRPQGRSAEVDKVRNNGWLQCVARLKPGATAAQAQAELDAIAAHLATEYPDTNARLGYRVVSFEGQRRDGQTVLWVIMGLAISVLLIACANLANLQLVRAARRVGEHTIRIALGSTRWQLVRLLLTESLIVSLAGGALGVLLALWGSELLGRHLTIGGGENGLPLPIDGNVLGFSLLATLATGLTFGLAPAFLASRHDINANLKLGAFQQMGRAARHRLRDCLMVAQIALALTLLTSVVLFARGVQRLTKLDLGCNTEHIVMGTFVLPQERYSMAQSVAFYDRLLERTAALPGVDHATLSRHLPFFDGDMTYLAVEGQEFAPGGTPRSALHNAVSTDFFATMGMRLLQGRTFSDADRAGAPDVVIVNETMAAQLWPGESPIGKRIGGGDPANPSWWEVVGVVNDTHFALSVTPPPSAFQFYRPIAQTGGNWITLALRTQRDEPSLGHALREAVRQIDPDIAVHNLNTVNAVIARDASNYSTTNSMLFAFAILGLLLAAVGIYSVTANLVVQRTREIGVRVALGAQMRDVIALVLKKGVLLVALGTGLGLTGIFGTQRLLAAFLPVSLGSDMPLLCVSVAVLVGSALLACWIPARRATRVDPMIALRNE